MLPLASNTKLFTTATALSKLGPSSTIPTKVLTDGTVDSEGVLHGSLYLQGGGDPALGTPAFYDSYLAGLGTNIFALVPQLKRAGIKQVTGRLYGDDTIFDRKRGVADSHYATSVEIGPLSGLDYNSGFAGNTSSSHFSSDPAKLATQTLDNSMRHSGIKISPTIALGKTPAGAKSVAVVRSPPISEIVNTTDVYSDNFFAEMLEKLLGARFGGAGTTAAGTHVVEEYAQSLGSDIRQADGSGLTHSNLASPDDVVKLLRRIQNELFDAGADLATPLPTEPPEYPQLRIDESYVTALEAACDEYNAALPTLRSFVLPGGTAGAALLHTARAVTRRAERTAWSAVAAHGPTISAWPAKYLNRLSDLLFILARAANGEPGDVLWHPGGDR